MVTIVKKFTRQIGNPPYNKGLYCDFIEIAADYLTEDGEFDLLLPTYTFTNRGMSINACRDQIRLTSVDMTVGEYFRKSITGTWVARFRGTIGSTGDDEFDLTLPSGETIKTRLSDVNPGSQKFISPNGLSSVDYSIVRKVLTSTVEYNTDTITPVSCSNFTYIQPLVKYISKPSPAAGSFNIRGVCNNKPDGVKDGWWIKTNTPEDADRILRIYTESKLFTFVSWATFSDYGGNFNKHFMKLLPDVTKLTYKNETDLYEQFGLTDDEIARIESILG